MLNSAVLYIYRNYLIQMVILLRDNIQMVISTADEVRMRYSFMKNVAFLPQRGHTENEIRLMDRFSSLQRKIDEVKFEIFF